MSPIVSIPSRTRRSSARGPTPGRIRIGNGARNAASRPGRTTVSPPGLRRSEATFATTFDVATPSEHESWVRARTTAWTASASGARIVERRARPRRGRGSPRRSPPARPSARSRGSSTRPRASSRGRASAAGGRTRRGDSGGAPPPPTSRSGSRIRARRSCTSRRRRGRAGRRRRSAAPVAARGVLQLLDGGEERVQVEVRDDHERSVEMPVAVPPARSRPGTGDNPVVARLVTVVCLLAFAAGAAAWRLADVKPDPNVQAIADGCQRDTTKIYTGLAPNWAYVNDRDFPSAGAPPATQWVSGTVQGRDRSARLAHRELGRSDHPPFVRREHRRHGRPARRLPDRCLPRRDARARDDPHGARVHRRSPSGRGLGRATTCRRSAPGSGTATTTSPTARRRSSIRSAPPGSCAPPRPGPHGSRRRAICSSRPTRRRRARRRSARTRRRARTSSSPAAHAYPDWLSVNGAYAFDLPIAERDLHASVASDGRPRRASTRLGSQRPGRAGRGTSPSRSRRPEGKRVFVARQLFATCGKLACDRPPAPALRQAAGPPGHGSELSAGQAGLPRRERVDAARPDRDRAGRVAADVERRRDLGTLARDARRAGRLDVRRQAERRLLSSRPAGRGRSSRWRGNATSARCRAGTGRVIRRRRARSRTRSATPRATTIPARSRSPTAAPALGRHVIERGHRRLDLPAVEREGVLSAHVHGQPCALTEKGTR